MLYKFYTRANLILDNFIDFKLNLLVLISLDNIIIIKFCITKLMKFFI